MEWNLRLADRRGLLQGRDLSPVAVVACELLMLLDRREAAKDYWNRVRISLIAGESDPERIKQIFPELFPKKAQEPITDETDIDDIDLSAVEWKAPSTASTKDDFLELQREIQQAQRGTLRFGEGATGEGGWQ